MEACHLKDSARAILLVVPLVILITSAVAGIFGLARIYSARTQVESQTPDRTVFASLDLTVENRSLDWYNMKVDLTYYVQANMSRSAELSMFISGEDGAFQVPSANMQDAGETLAFFRDGTTVGRYRSLTFEYRTRVPIREESSWLFPWDSYSSPTVYFWANFTIYAQLRIVSNPPQGFVWHLESLAPVSAARVAEEIPPLERLFMARPPNEVQAFAFRIILLHEAASFSTSAFYAMAGIMIVWLAGGLAWTGIRSGDRRIPALIAMAIAALAFSWSFRQVAPPSPTLAESLVVGIAMSWLLLEAKELLRTRSMGIAKLEPFLVIANSAKSAQEPTGSKKDDSNQLHRLMVQHDVLSSLDAILLLLLPLATFLIGVAPRLYPLGPLGRYAFFFTILSIGAFIWALLKLIPAKISGSLKGRAQALAALDFLGAWACALLLLVAVHVVVGEEILVLSAERLGLLTFAGIFLGYALASYPTRWLAGTLKSRMPWKSAEIEEAFSSTMFLRAAYTTKRQTVAMVMVGLILLLLFVLL